MLWTINIQDQVLLAECESASRLRKRLVESLGSRARTLDIRPAAGEDMLNHLTDHEVIINFSQHRATISQAQEKLATDGSKPSPLSFRLYVDPAA